MHFVPLFILGIILTTSIQAEKQSTIQNLQKASSKTVFAHKKNEHLYWQALLQVANGDKNGALNTLKMLKDGAPGPSFDWQVERPTSIDVFFDKLFLDSAMYSPESLTFLSLFESIGIQEHNAQLDDISVESARRCLEIAKKNCVILESYCERDLSFDQKISHRIFSWQLKHRVAGERFLFHPYKVTQFHGVARGIPYFLTQLHKLETAENIEHYIARICVVPKQITQAIECVILQEEKGIVPPRFAIEKVINIIQKLTPENVHESLFYQHVKQKLTMMHVQDQDTVLERVAQAVKQHLYPAYRSLQAHYTGMLERVHANYGVWSLPDGDDYYAYMLQQHTTTNLSADEIHTLGLQEVDNIHTQMRSILEREGLNDPDKTVGALMQALLQGTRFYYSNRDEGRAQCLADFRNIIERSRGELGHLFGFKPYTGVSVQRVPLHDEHGAAGAYYSRPSIDGSRAGTFFVNLRDMAEVPQYGMETLAIHEAEPGHHFQLALQVEVDIPVLRKLGVYTAHAEGWALYAEKLAYEYGFYTSSFSQLGHFQDELMRAARLVIDTGIHYKRWTREHAIDYMQEVTGMHYNSVVTEVERYFVLPGQACAYKIGQLKILELRKRAKDMLGERFDIKEFHDIILRTAAVPLVVLEEVINAYIKDKQIA